MFRYIDIGRTPVQLKMTQMHQQFAQTNHKLDCLPENPAVYLLVVVNRPVERRYKINTRQMAFPNDNGTYWEFPNTN